MSLSGERGGLPDTRFVQQSPEKLLFVIRRGAEVGIIHDPQMGWEMSGDGLPCDMPLDTGEHLVNTILQSLAHHYRQFWALLGNPDRHEASLLTPK